MTKNRLLITGRVIAQFDNSNGSTALTVITKNGRDVYLRILAPPGVLPETLPRRAHISIEGHFESYFSKKSDRIKQRLVADKIEIQKTLTEEAFGVKGRFYSPFFCKAELAGSVKKVITDGEWIRYIVDVGDNNSLVLSMKALDRQPDIQKDDNIYAVCSLTSVEKEFDGEKVHIENIIIHDLAI